MLDRRFLDVSIVVAGIANSPAASPTAGTQYIVGSSPAGDFSGAKANQLARYDGSKWIFSTPKTNGLEVLNVETKEVLSFDGTAWTAKTTLGGGGSNEFIAPVDLVTNLALIHPYGSPVSYPDNAEVGDKIVVIGYFNDKYVSVDIRRKEENDWNLVSKMTNGQRYAVKYRDANNNFIYEILAGISISDNPADPTGNQITRETIPVGGMFLNKADSLVYVYDGEKFEAVNTGGDSGGGEHEGHNFFIPEYSCVEYKSKSSVYDPGELVKDGDMIYRADSSGHIQNEVDYSEFRVGSIFFFDKVKSGDHGDAFPLYRFNGVDAENRFDFIDYVQDGDLLFNKVNKHFYVFETSNFYRFTDIGGIGESSSGGGDEIITETHTLTAEEATAKSFNLANSIKSGKETDVFLSVCGMVQIAGVDYTASENTISWSDKTLADIGLQAGDVFLVQYTKA